MEDKLRETYDKMNPTEEQEERMLAALLEAQQAADGRAPEQKRGGFRAWKVAVPLAACLVLGATFVGMGVMNRPTEAPTSSTEAASPNAAAPKGEMKLLEMDSAAEADGMACTADVEAIEPEHPFNTEEYAAVDENGFVATATQPLSTVSADVDTASYANLRRMIDDGSSLKSVPSGAVRTEEILNYFTYDYARPTGDEKFSMQAQASQCPWNADTQLLTIGFATPYETGVAEKGANLVFLVDVSGSMDDPDKLGLLQDSFATLLESLDGNDRVSIVTYANGEELVLDGARGDDDQAILRAIYRLRADGATNGERGLQMAYEVAERNFIEGGVNRIVMASDGDLNVGITSQSDLYDFVDGKRETGVYLSVLGFGAGNYKDTKMETLADHGNGSYHYIDSIDEAKRVLSERLMANLVPFADDVKVQVEFNPAQVKAYRLIGYENRELAAEDFLDDSVDAGDVGPNAQFTVAYEVVLAGSPYEVNVPDLKYGTAAEPGGSSDWLTCSLRYRAFDDGEVHSQEMAIGGGSETAQPSDDWRFASAVIEFAMLARDSDYRGGASFDSVLGILDQIGLNSERAGFRELVEKAKEQSA